MSFGANQQVYQAEYRVDAHFTGFYLPELVVEFNSLTTNQMMVGRHINLIKLIYESRNFICFNGTITGSMTTSLKSSS